MSFVAGQPKKQMCLQTLQQTFRDWLTTETDDIAARFDERARAGLAVYLNNYRAQLLACMSASYPALRAWIGDTAFEAAAASHIDDAPPHDWTLDAYGLDFPETLEGLHPADPEIAELARFERELGAAFVGPDATPIDPAELTDVDWDAAIIRLVPTFRLLSVTTNVAAIWSAISKGETPPSAALLPEPATLAIWRHDLTPKFRTLTAEEATSLQHVHQGKTFGALCAALVEGLGEERAAALAGSLLGQWLSDRLVAAVMPGSCGSAPQ
jgi:hypothetical protein